MTNKCDKCGATTRWYDETCPVCGDARTVELPTTPIPLPRFAPSGLATRRDSPAVVPFPQDAENARVNVVAQPSTDKTPPEVAQQNPTDKTTPEVAQQNPTDETTPEVAQQNPTDETAPEVAKEKTTDETVSEVAQQNPTDETVSEVAQQKQARPDQVAQAAARAEPPLKLTDEPSTEAALRRQRRFVELKKSVAAWRSAFSPTEGNVTLPPGRALRYALGIAFELVVCPPCAIIAAYFLTRALRADRRARYYAAMNETEKARLALGVGVGVFAIGLCAFMYYVHSQEIHDPAPPTRKVRLFR